MLSVLHTLERVAPHTRLSQQRAAAGEEGASSGGGAEGEGGPQQSLLEQLLPSVVALVSPGHPLLPLPICTAAMDVLTAWAAAGNAAEVQGC